MKKIITILLIQMMILGLLTGCGKAEKGPSITVFAAASLTETLTEIAECYKEVEPEVSIVFNFDSSGTLKTQIEEGAQCDLFISAAAQQMDELDCVLEESRMNLLENKVTLVVPEGNPKNIQTYEDLIKGLEAGNLMLAMGNADVPVGQYTKKIIAYYGLSGEDIADVGCTTYGSNVKEIVTQVSEAVVDCGIIYATDAYSAGLSVVDTATDDMCGQVIYPAAVLENSEDQEAAKEFLDFLTTEKAAEIFERVGFTTLNK